MAVKRAALYIRVSTDEQARHGLSLGEQRADLLKFAQDKGYEVVGIYADEGFSARKALSRRRQLQRLLNDVRADKIDLILLKSLDRWFRNIADYYKVQEILDQHGVAWECTQENYNTTTAQGLLHLNIKLSIAQNESDQTSERIKYVFAGKKERREALGGAIPLGYKVENKKIILDPAKSPAVTFLFDHFISGGNLCRATAALRERFNITYTVNAVKEILKNRAYIGELYGIPGYIEPLISLATFERVQDVLSRNAKHAPSGRIYLFSGLVRCPNCGKRMAANRGRLNAAGECLRPRYVCMDGVIKARPCTFSRAIYEHKLENYLLDNLQNLAREYIVKMDRQRAKTMKDDPAAQIETLKAKLSRLEDAYIDGLMSKDKYAASYKEINKELSALSVLVDSNLTTSPILREIAANDNIRTMYDNLTRENKQRFWKTIFRTITYKDTPETRGKGAYIPFEVTFL